MTWAFIGYGAILTLIFLYIAGLHRRQAALEREVELLRDARAGDEGDE